MLKCMVTLKMMFNDDEKVVRKFVHAFDLKMELAKMIANARVNHEDLSKVTCMM